MTVKVCLAKLELLWGAGGGVTCSKCRSVPAVNIFLLNKNQELWDLETVAQNKEVYSTLYNTWSQSGFFQLQNILTKYTYKNPYK